MSNYKTINFVQKPAQQYGALWCKLTVVSLFVIYLGCACLWLFLIWQHSTLDKANIDDQIIQAKALMKQKHQLLQPLNHWDQQYQQQIKLVLMWQWLINSNPLQSIDYENGHLSIVGKLDSKRQIKKYRRRFKRHFAPIHLKLNDIHHQNGNWQFELGAKLYD